MTEKRRAITGEQMEEGPFLIEGVDPSHPEGLALAVQRAGVAHLSPEGIGVAVQLEKGGHVIMVIPPEDWEQMVRDVEGGAVGGVPEHS